MWDTGKTIWRWFPYLKLINSPGSILLLWHLLCPSVTLLGMKLFPPKLQRAWNIASCRCPHHLTQLKSFPTVCSMPILTPGMGANSEAEAEAIWSRSWSHLKPKLNPTEAEDKTFPTLCRMPILSIGMGAKYEAEAEAEAFGDEIRSSCLLSCLLPRQLFQPKTCLASEAEFHAPETVYATRFFLLYF